jgi:nucleoside-diphosphate-sugar epimerase
MSKHVSILGCGWLGKPLGAALAKEGYVVMGSTTRHENISGLKAAGIVPFVVDVDKAFSEDVFPFFNTDVLVISLPQRARAGKAEHYKGQIQKVMAAACDGHVGNILLISTTSVYPNHNRVVLEQDADVQNPITQAERIVQESGVPTTVIRFAGLFGPGRDPGRFLARRDVVAGENHPVNLIHMDDCIEILKHIIHHNRWDLVLNACADEHPTKMEFYTKAALALGVQPPIFSDDGQAGYKIVSSERLKEILDYNFIHRLV